MGNIHPKVQAAGLGGAVTSVLMWVLALLHVNLPPEVAAALATVAAFVCGYIKVGDLPAPLQDVVDVVEAVTPKGDAPVKGDAAP